MPESEIKSDFAVETQGDETLVKVHLKNKTDKLAFFIELKAKGNTSVELILLVFWSDNYVSLLPGEERDLMVKINTRDLKGEKISIEIKGLNTK